MSFFAEWQVMDLFARYALVADDNPLIRMDAQAILMEAGFGVFTASGFEDAADILASCGNRIQLLFTDVQMPPGTRTGYDLARLCARDWPEIGILVASATPPPEPGDMPEGAMFLAKPFSADTVKTCIARVMAGR
jgi:DNA-binding NtrC family response regulator